MKNEISLPWAWGLLLNHTPGSPWSLPWQETVGGERWYFPPQNSIFFLGLLSGRHERLADLQVMLTGIQSKTTHPFLKDSRSRSRLPYMGAWWDYMKPHGLSSGAFLHLDEENWERGSKWAVALAGGLQSCAAPTHLGREMWRALCSLLWSWLKLKTCRRLCHFSLERLEVRWKWGKREVKRESRRFSLLTLIPLLLRFQCSFLNFWEECI